MKTGAERLAEERARQVAKKGWTAEHDDQHDDGQLALAAVCYAASAACEHVYVKHEYAASISIADPWPWPGQYCDARPYDGNVLKEPTKEEAIRLLEKAGALIAAEIDRLLRARVAKESR